MVIIHCFLKTVKFKYVCTSITPDRNDVRNSLNFNSETPHSVCKQIKYPCSAKATGSDKISARLLKTEAHHISDSLLPIISKIMERILHDQLYQFIEENNILNKWQSGFRPGYSTETAMTYVTDLLLTEMDTSFNRGQLTLARYSKYSC